MITAWAHTNIALVKYWGKRDDGGRRLNLPAVGSLSLTLDGFGTETSVALGDDADRLVLDGVERGGEEKDRVCAFLDVIRQRAGRTERATVTSTNRVPTAAGLASSASGFAALALAASSAYGLSLTPRELSILARQGSGSAARSIFGGFVFMHRGETATGEDAFAEPIGTNLQARLVVVRCGTGKKATGSRAGMEHTRRTSPMYPAWLETHAADLDAARAALAAADIEQLGEVMEFSTQKMHATTFTSRPGYWYWSPVTLAVLDAVRALRAMGTGAWATMDAGPHVKVLCAPPDAAPIRETLRTVPGVVSVDVAGPGGPASLVEQPRP